jgi:hypothetical protein|mmetsp:Transcript_63175/g.101765  ORF Transcript_63175/g.101765 Transcript_63175/m.101765 type:complete len:80 (+) Transcript_63175:1465-1704(+)
MKVFCCDGPKFGASIFLTHVSCGVVMGESQDFCGEKSQEVVPKVGWFECNCKGGLCLHIIVQQGTLWHMWLCTNEDTCT